LGLPIFQLGASNVDVLKSFLTLRDLFDSFLDGALDGLMAASAAASSNALCFLASHYIQAFGLQAFI
jgi:hypothetical protein